MNKIHIESIDQITESEAFEIIGLEQEQDGKDKKYFYIKVNFTFLTDKRSTLILSFLNQADNLKISYIKNKLEKSFIYKSRLNILSKSYILKINESILKKSYLEPYVFSPSGNFNISLTTNSNPLLKALFFIITITLSIFVIFYSYLLLFEMQFMKYTIDETMNDSELPNYLDTLILIYSAIIHLIPVFLFVKNFKKNPKLCIVIFIFSILFIVFAYFQLNSVFGFFH